jgi:predicted ArsR family transcriptional regulator
MSVMLTPSHERQARIAAVLRTSRLTRSQICERFGISPSRARQLLEALTREGRVRCVGSGKAKAYEAVPEESLCPTS